MKLNNFIKLIQFIVKGIKNWPRVLLFSLGLIDEFVCKFKNLGNIKLNKKDKTSGLFGFLMSISLYNISQKEKNELTNILSQRENKLIKMSNGLRMLNQELSLIIETFVLEQFSLDKGNNENIIDIGANKGDTALFFASKNYNVVAFEPVSELYKIAISNIKLNKTLTDKITLVKKAVSCKKGKTKIFFNEDLDKSSGDSSQYANDKSKYELVDTITIEDIINDFNINPYILKMDCEGCEYDIILNSDLSMFKEIYFEYHENFTGKNHELLIEKLEKQGFELVDNEEIPLVEGVGLVKMVKK